MRNMRQIKRVKATCLWVLEGTGVEGDPYREEEYIYLDDEDKLFVINRGRGEVKVVEEEE